MCFAYLMCYLFWYVVNEIVKKKNWRAGPSSRQPANKQGGVEFLARTSKLVCPGQPRPTPFLDGLWAGRA
jgi:hypothetical protein